MMPFLASKMLAIRTFLTLLAVTFHEKRAALLASFDAADRARSGFISAGISGIGTLALTIVAVILAAVVGLRVIAALFPTYGESVRAIADGFNNTTWGDGTANVISPIFRLLVALAGLIAIVGLVLLAVNLHKKHS